jgi:hypothetical protein
VNINGLSGTATKEQKDLYLNAVLNANHFDGMSDNLSNDYDTPDEKLSYSELKDRIRI